MASTNYIRNLIGLFPNIQIGLDLLPNKILNASISNSNAFLQGYTVLRDQIGIKSINSYLDLSQYRTITFVNGKSQNGISLWELPRSTYKLPILKYNEKYKSNAVTTVVTNACILSALNPSLNSKQTPLYLFTMYVLFFCNYYMAETTKKHCIEDLLAMCLARYIELTDTQMLKDEVIKQNMKNIKDRHKHNDYVTLGCGSQSEKVSATTEAKNNERDKFIVKCLKEGMGYRDIVAEYESLFGRNLSIGVISKVKNKVFTSFPGECSQVSREYEAQANVNTLAQ